MHRMLCLVATLGLATAAAAQVPNPLFDQTIARVGDDPEALATADFNADGLTDVVSANTTAATLTVLVGHGNANFTTGATLPVGSKPMAVVAGDFNGDGRSDLAAAEKPGFVRVLLATGNLAFASPIVIPVGGNIQDFASGDFNEDGKLDLITIDEAGNGNSRILLGTGAGLFLSSGNLGLPNYPDEVQIGDANGDGHEDALVVVSTTVEVRLGHGDGTFSAAAPLSNGSSTTTGLQTADLDGDGDLDFALSHTTATAGESYRLWRGANDGSFVAGPVVDNAFAEFAVAADFDADGKLDLITAYSNVPRSLHALGNGNFAPADLIYLGASAADLVTADFDGDDSLDLAAPLFAVDSVEVVRGAGNGTFHEYARYPLGIQLAHGDVADVNGDGLNDVVCAIGLSPVGFTDVIFGQANGSFGPFATSPAGNDPERLAIGDFNGDDKPDLALAESAGNDTRVLLGHGDGSFSDTWHGGATQFTKDVAVADFDSDGKLDLASCSLSSSFTVFMGHGDGTFTALTAVPCVSSSDRIFAVDFSADGHPDLIIASDAINCPGCMDLRRGNGDGSFQPLGIIQAGMQVRDIGFGDLNEDGLDDLVTANHGAGTVSVMPGVGPGGFAPQTTYAAVGAPDEVCLCDFDGDGHLDVSCAAGASVSVFRGVGNGTLVPLATHDMGQTAWNLFAVDQDLDGALDLLGSDVNSKSLNVAFNRTLDADYPWSTAGYALAGGSGAPQLVGSGNLATGSSGSLALGGAAPAAVALVFVSLGSSPAAFKGGTLVPLPALLILPAATSGSGALTLQWNSWPAGLSGLHLYFQEAVQDAGAVHGVALSNALRGDVP